jgi:nucleotide-binding universal stress UspA family protein
VVFERVICGIDASEASLEAARQAARLVAADGRLVLLAVVETEVAVHAGWAAGAVLGELSEEAEQALARAHAEVAHLRLAEARLLDGPVVARFRNEIEQERATLVCVGTHGHSRAGGIALGSLTTTLLHDAPCSVLVARPPSDPAAFPSRIVVGVDGSTEADKAAAVAAALRDRFGASLLPLVASGGRSVDTERALDALPEGEVRPGKPVDVLVEACADADLLVVGSRGLHGVRALGSVGERVAHRAPCSVLAVR